MYKRQGRDLQGVWDFRSVVPFERPDGLEGRETLTAEEAAAFEQERVDAFNVDLRRDENGRIPLSGGYNNFWYDRGASLGEERRTSLVGVPPDGKIPARTAAAEERGAERIERLWLDSYGPEDRGAFERCILGFNAGPPMNPSAYNNNFIILQSPGYVVIYAEMIHDTRIIPIDGGGHIASSMRQWHGDARGHWEGDTLVVETRNIRRTEANAAAVGGDQVLLRAANGRTDDTIAVTERFTRVDARTVNYAVSYTHLTLPTILLV